MLQQIITVFLTIFYVFWLCFMMWAARAIVLAVQIVANAVIAEQQKRVANDHPK
jgi:hypothetical protein